MSIFDFILKFVPVAAQAAARRAPAEVEVYVARNELGGWSIFASNEHARELLGDDAPTGNFGTYAAAHQRAEDHNCWVVVDAPALPGMRWGRGARRPVAQLSSLNPQRREVAPRA